jgi:hypothetical protein
VPLVPEDVESELELLESDDPELDESEDLAVEEDG